MVAIFLLKEYIMSTLNNYVESIHRLLHKSIKVRTILGQTYRGILTTLDMDRKLIVLECNNSGTIKDVVLFLDYVVTIE